MAFVPGTSGNPAGRPKLADLEAVDLSILRALRKVVRKNPRLLEEAIQRRLESRDNFGMIELIGKLTKELGTKDEQPTQIAIVFNGNLNPNALKGVEAKVLDGQEVRELSESSSRQQSISESETQEILQSDLQESGSKS